MNKKAEGEFAVFAMVVFCIFLFIGGIYALGGYLPGGQTPQQVSTPQLGSPVFKPTETTQAQEFQRRTGRQAHIPSVQEPSIPRDITVDTSKRSTDEGIGIIEALKRGLPGGGGLIQENELTLIQNPILSARG